MTITTEVSVNTTSRFLNMMAVFLRRAETAVVEAKAAEEHGDTDTARECVRTAYGAWAKATGSLETLDLFEDDGLHIPIKVETMQGIRSRLTAVYAELGRLLITLG